MEGVFSIFEIADDSNKRPHKTVVCLLKTANGKSFSDSQWKSLENVGKRAKENGASVFYNLEDTVKYLNRGVKNEK